MNNGTASFTIPPLAPILEVLDSKNISIKLETILDNHHSIIWEDKAEIEIPVSVTTKKPVIQDKETSKKIKVKKIKEEVKVKEKKNKKTPIPQTSAQKGVGANMGIKEIYGELKRNKENRL